MKFECWLVVAKPTTQYRNPAIRITSKKPGVKGNEIAISLSVELPDMLFERPAIQANIIIPPEMASPPRISADALASTKEILEGQLGITVDIVTVPPTEIGE